MRIILKDMVFYGYHGVQDEERTLGQRFIVTIKLNTDDVHDKYITKLEDTVDYTKVYEVIKNVMEKDKFLLLENCANKILDTLLESFTLVQTATISIRKPSVPIQGQLSFSEIEMIRGR
ncbi:MAG: dihydroneopterin aldolase [Candidatus Cloacimonadales bacterium]